MFWSFFNESLKVYEAYYESLIVVLYKFSKLKQ